jgi:hypothetical protein
MGKSSEGNSDRLTTTQLLLIAQGSEPDITARTLEFWRHQDLLPKAERTSQDGTRPVWTYPAAAAGQLRALLRLRKASKEPDVLRSSLWFDGYPVPASRARESMIAYLRKVQAGVDKEIARRTAALGPDAEGARAEAIAEAARDFASRRTRGLPRFGRQSLADRVGAMEAMFRLGLDEGTEPGQVDERTAAAIERVMGVDQGRRYRPEGAQPWLTGPATEALPFFQEFGSLSRLIDALDSADEPEFRWAGERARIFLAGVVAFSQVADAAAGYRNASGLAGVEILKDEPAIRVMLTAWMISAMRQQAIAENVKEVTAALTETILPIETYAREVAALPEAERAARLQKLPWTERRRIVRLIESLGPA